jgi:hypothetical protein
MTDQAERHRTAARGHRAGAGLLSRPIGNTAFLGVVAAVFLAAFAGTLALPHDPQLRYQSFNGTIFDRLGWVWDRIAHDDTPIDVIVVGSSRSARGVNAAAVEAALADLGRPGLHVANISEPAAGMDIRLTKLRDAFAHHPEIRLVVLGVVEALPRDGHQAFGDLADAGEILTAPWILNRNQPANLAALPYRQLELAVAGLVPEAFGYRAGFDPAAYPGPTPDHRDFNDGDWAAREAAQRARPVDHATALAVESNQRRREITPPVLPDALAWAEFGVSRHYLRAIVDLAAEHGAKVAFLFLPFYDGYDAPVDAAWLDRLGPLWNARFLKNDPANYFDAAHASGAGIALVTPWLAAQIDTALETSQ